MITYSAQATSVLVGTSATLLAAADKDRSHLEIAYAGLDPVYVGGSGVDSSTGLPIKTSTGPLRLVGVSATAAVYGVFASGPQYVSVFEVLA